MNSNDTENKKLTRTLILPETISVKNLADLIDEDPIDVIKQLMRNGIMAGMNQVVDHQVARLITNVYGISARYVEPKTSELKITSATSSNTELPVRPPVVTILGHVDHGKTSLLDKIRESHIADKELGGITQHIGAYQVSYESKTITFLDTPGHAAFTSIRSRGVRLTDIAVLVVAADDGIMPQTIEAINHAKAADVPLIVAMNKIDTPGADTDKIKRQLSEEELLVEEWGGEVIAVPVSAMTGEGIENLLENILLVSEILELRANPDSLATGVVIEAKLDKQKGPTATVLIQEGSLKIGDYIFAGNVWGRVKALSNHLNESMTSATPGTPVEILGFNGVPEAGVLMKVASSEKEVKALITKSNDNHNSLASKTLTLNEVAKKIDSGELKTLNLVLKADVQGSLEAVSQSIQSLESEQVQIQVIHSASGAINESDILLAGASDAVILGFSLPEDPNMLKIAERAGIEIRYYNIIYQLLEDMQKAVDGMIELEVEEIYLGKVEIREIFPGKKNTAIAGCRVIDGKIVKNAMARILRAEQVIDDCPIISLRHFRDEVNEITTGMECGIQLGNFNDYAEGDILEIHRQK
ncbi:MAG TPA: translation initiation factor IF-2 [Dehalococcoidia bacterium]|nr:translation initiation factor IF-2 [Dehalococcoidia bacterium]|tara:strand:+ start:564 stop:2321 length:1758 start_codon:yes stop_codon:yes gene_type:complete